MMPRSILPGHCRSLAQFSCSSCLVLVTQVRLCCTSNLSIYVIKAFVACLYLQCIVWLSLISILTLPVCSYEVGIILCPQMRPQAWRGEGSVPKNAQTKGPPSELACLTPEPKRNFSRHRSIFFMSLQLGYHRIDQGAYSWPVCHQSDLP